MALTFWPDWLARAEMSNQFDQLDARAAQLRADLAALDSERRRAGL